MSININEIYFTHNLKDKNLEYFNIQPKYKYIFYPNPNGDSSILLNVKDTIHYNALVTNNYKYYEEYVKIAKQYDHNLRTYLRLKNNFDLTKMRKVKVKYDNNLNKFILQGGTHRLSILTFKKYFHNDNIPIELIEDITNKKESSYSMIIICFPLLSLLFYYLIILFN